MRYYTIQNDSILIADNEQALTRFYDNVLELPEDYEEGKYIVGEVEEEIDVPDFETVEEEYEEPVYVEQEILDENNEVIGHKQVIDHYETKTREVQVPVLVDGEPYTITVPDYEIQEEEYEEPVYVEQEILDENNEVIGYEKVIDHYETKTREVQVQTGEHEETITPKVQVTHKETVMVKRLVPNPDWEQEQAQKEAERIARLHLTRGDVFRGLLLAKGVTRAQIRALIEAMPDETQEQQVTKELALIDFDEALDFYRGVALIDTVGAQLGISSAQMTAFFETNDYHELIKE